MWRCLRVSMPPGSRVTSYAPCDNDVVSESLWIAIAVIAVLVVVALVVGLVRYRRRRISLSSADTATPVDRSGGYTASSGITFTQSAPAEPVERIDTSGLPAVGDDATIPRDAPKRTIADVQLPEPALAEPEPAAPQLDEVAPVDGRLDRLRGRLAKSQNTLGRGMLGLLGGGDLDEASWEAVEDTLLIADLGPVVTESVVTSLRSRMASSRVRTESDARAVLREVLIEELHPDLDRSIKALPHANKPSVLLVVGVNGNRKAAEVGQAGPCPGPRRPPRSAWRCRSLPP